MTGRQRRQNSCPIMKSLGRTVTLYKPGLLADQSLHNGDVQNRCEAGERENEDGDGDK